MLNYEIQGKIVVIKGCGKDVIDLEIPTEIEGLPVSKIEVDAFIEHKNLKYVKIPGSVKVISGYAFSGCMSLQKVELQEGVEYIEDWAFSNTSLKTINIPKTVKSLGQNCFLGSPVRKFCEPFINQTSRRSKFQTNNRCIVLPTLLLGDRTSITNETITNRSKYLEDQFESIERAESVIQQLDIPFIFDKDDVLLAIYNKKALEDLSVELSSESKTHVGAYLDTDDDFIVLKFNVYTKGQFITSFFCKTPYCEAATFTIKSVEYEEREDGYFYYFVNMTASINAFGTGNLNKVFYLDLFDDLLGKYTRQREYNLIKEETYNSLCEVIKAKREQTIKAFLFEVAGAPFYTLLLKVLDKISKDPEYDTESINEYISAYCNYAIGYITSPESLRDLCYDTQSMLEFIENITQHDINELLEIYDLELLDDHNEIIDYDSALALKDSFIDNEDNYLIHSEFLNYVLKELRRINREYSVLCFEE